MRRRQRGNGYPTASIVRSKKWRRGRGLKTRDETDDGTRTTTGPTTADRTVTTGTGARRDARAGKRTGIGIETEIIDVVDPVAKARCAGMGPNVEERVAVGDKLSELKGSRWIVPCNEKPAGTGFVPHQ